MRAKVRRDLSPRQGRTRLAVVSVVIGVVAVGSTATAASVLEREIDRAHTSATPSAITVTLDEWDEGAVSITGDIDGVSGVEIRSETMGRIFAEDGDPVPVRLIVVEDFASTRIDTHEVVEGAPAPSATGVLVEQASERDVDLDVGSTLQVGVDGTTTIGYVVEGVVHDPGQMPGWMTGLAIAYVTPDGFERLGVARTMELRVSTDGSRAENQIVAADLRAALKEAGHTVAALDVPEPDDPPTATVTGALMFLLQAFGAITLVAAAVLIAIVTSALLERQRGSIGVLKSLGGSPGQVGRAYLIGVAWLGGLGTVIGIPVGIAAGYGYSLFAAGLLNIDIVDPWPTPWVVALQAGVGVVVPVLAAAVPVHRTARSSVRADLDGTQARVPRGARRTSSSPARAAMLRNLTRTPVRTVLTIVGLGIGGAAFMAALNTGVAWTRTIDVEFEEVRAYAAEIMLGRAYPIDDVEQVLGSIDQVSGAETWLRLSGQTRTGDGLGERYPVFVVPAGSAVASAPLVEGEHLSGAPGELVATQTVDDPALSAGDTAIIEIGGVATEWTVTGIERRLAAGGEGGAVYVTTLPSVVSLGDVTNHLVVDAPVGALPAIEAALSDAGISVVGLVTADDAREALDDHLFIIVGLLLVAAVTTGLVAALGLVETIGIGALERRREIGIMRAVGARTGTVLQVIGGEAVFMAVGSWIVALVLSVPVTLAVESMVGQIFVQTPLERGFSPAGVGIWLVIAGLVAVVSAGLPTLEITETPVASALAFE